MKTMDEILVETHGDKDYNYHGVKKAMHLWGEQKMQSMYELIFIGKQFEIWQHLTRVPLTTGELSKRIEMPSKNLSTQLKQMSRTGLVKFTNNGKLKSWYR